MAVIKVFSSGNGKETLPVEQSLEHCASLSIGLGQRDDINPLVILLVR